MIKSINSPQAASAPETGLVQLPVAQLLGTAFANHAAAAEHRAAIGHGYHMIGDLIERRDATL
jgi:hypothetical protein